jgi:hypothetical protein
MENAGIGEEIWGGEGEVMEGLVNWVMKEFWPDLDGYLILLITVSSNF